jgi:hypothetical protein
MRWLVVCFLLLFLLDFAMVDQVDATHPNKPCLCDAQTCGARFKNPTQLSRHKRHCPLLTSEVAHASQAAAASIEHCEPSVIDEDIEMFPPVSPSSSFMLALCTLSNKQLRIHSLS